MANNKIVLLAGEGFSTNVVYNAVQNSLGIDTVILEAPVDKKTFLKRRIRKLGFIKVAGQVMFQAMIVPILSATSKKRRKELIDQYQLNDSPIPEDKISRVSSVNAAETSALLQQLNPDLVIVNGTRIISKKILSAIPCNFIESESVLAFCFIICMY